VLRDRVAGGLGGHQARTASRFPEMPLAQTDALIATPRYEERLVAFLDILGFEDLIERSVGPDAQVGVDNIRHALEAPTPVGPEAIVLGRIGDISESDHRMTCFSDSIAISVEPTEKGLMLLLHHIARIGWRLTELRMLLRGGIARGDLYHEGSIVFGPAFLKAYRMERKVARFPRVVLGEEVAALGLSVAAPVDEIFRRFARRDEDGLHFVNVLWVLRTAMDSASEPLEEWRQLCEKIDAWLAEEGVRSADHPRRREKIDWFRRYFDWATDRSIFELVRPR